MTDPRASARSANSPARGNMVFSISGEALGDVAEVRPDSFLLRRNRPPDLWVKSEAVFSVANGSVQLICYGDGLNRWCLDPND